MRNQRRFLQTIDLEIKKTFYETFFCVNYVHFHLTIETVSNKLVQTSYKLTEVYYLSHVKAKSLYKVLGDPAAVSRVFKTPPASSYCPLCLK